MALGQAFIDVHANTTGFAKELSAKLKSELAKVEGKIKIAPTGFPAFRAAITDATKNLAVKVHISPTGIPAFRAAITDATKNLAAKVHIEPTGIAAFRTAIADATKGVAAKVTITPTGIPAFRAAITQATLTTPVKIYVTPAGLPAFRAAIAAAAAASPIPIPIIPQITGFGEGLGGALGPIKSIADGFADIAKRVFQADAAIGAFGIKGTIDLEKLEAALSGVVAANQKLDLTKPKQFAVAMQEVNRQIGNLRDFNKIAPQFSFRGLTEAASSIQTLGLNGKQALDVTKLLTNALAAAGRASDANLQGAVIPLLQAASTGKFLGQDLNQLAQRLPGVFNRGQVLRNLQKDLKLTDEAFQKLRETGLPAAETIAAVLQQLGESPVAKGALERQLNTVSGQFFRIRRTIEQGIQDTFKDTRPALTKALAELGPQVQSVFSPDGSLLTGIRDFVLAAIPVLGGLIGPISKFVETVNTVFLAAIRAIGPEIGPVADKVAELAEALGPKIIASIPLAIDFVKDLAHNVGVLVTPLVDIAGVLYDISQSPAGPVLEKVAAALAAIALSFAAVTVLRGVALALAGIALGGGAAGASGSLALLAARFRPFLIGGAILLGLDAINNKINDLTGSSGGLTTRLKEGLNDVKLFGGDIFDGVVNGAQGAANGVTAALNAIPGVDIDTSEFNQKMDSASARVIGLHETLNGLPKQVHTDYTLTINTLFTSGGQHAASSAQSLANEFTAEKQQRRDAAKEAAAGVEKTASSSIESIKDAINKALAGFGTGGGGAGGGGGGGSSGKAAADAAKRAADAFAERIRAILDGLDVSFRETLTTGARKAVDNALESLEKAIHTAFKGKKTKLDDKLIDFIVAGNKDLDKLIKERDGLTNRFGDHVDGLLDRLNKAVERAKAVADSVRSFADITNVDFKKAVDEVAATVTKLNTTTLDVSGSFVVTSRTIEKATTEAAAAVKHTGADFLKALQARRDAIKLFQDDIETLIRRGVNKTVIDQIIGAGVAGGSESADALANASDAVLKTVDKTQKEIDKRATELGGSAADSLFRAGKSAADGLIEGLKERRSEIADAVGAIATEMIKRIKKDLAIKSPSGVFRALANLSGDGAVLGLEDRVGHVGKAAAKIAKAAVPNFAPISIPQLQAAAAAEGSNALRAQGAFSSGGVTAEHLDRVIAAVAGARPNKEVHAAITQHFASPVTPASAKMAFSSVARR